MSSWTLAFVVYVLVGTAVSEMANKGHKMRNDGEAISGTLWLMGVFLWPLMFLVSFMLTGEDDA